MFGKKVLWSAARHAFMAAFTAGVGNVVLCAWDAMDATELATVSQDPFPLVLSMANT